MPEIKQEQLPKVQLELSETETQSGTGLVIIIVDDEPAIAKLYSLALQSTGFNVERIFANGNDVVEYVRNTSVGNENRQIAVIMDQMMPEMNGVTAAKKLRELKGNLKIIAASAYSIPQGDSPLFDSMLKKPFSIEELLRAIAEVTSQ